MTHIAVVGPTFRLEALGPVVQSNVRLTYKEFTIPRKILCKAGHCMELFLSIKLESQTRHHSLCMIIFFSFTVSPKTQQLIVCSVLVKYKPISIKIVRCNRNKTVQKLPTLHVTCAPRFAHFGRKRSARSLSSQSP